MNNSREIQHLRTQLIEKYSTVRGFTEQLCKPLEKEDFVVQSTPDVSPTRWHLAHTAWFFETFILKPELQDYETPMRFTTICLTPTTMQLASNFHVQSEEISAALR